MSAEALVLLETLGSVETLSQSASKQAERLGEKLHLPKLTCLPEHSRADGADGDGNSSRLDQHFGKDWPRALPQP